MFGGLRRHPNQAAKNKRLANKQCDPLLTHSSTVFAQINAHPEKSTQKNSDFSKGGVHKTDGFWWVIFQRGEYTKPMGFNGWFFKGGTTQNQWVVMGGFFKGGVHKTYGLLMGFGMFLYCFWKLSAGGVYFGKYGICFSEAIIINYDWVSSASLNAVPLSIFWQPFMDRNKFRILWLAFAKTCWNLFLIQLQDPINFTLRLIDWLIGLFIC